LPLVLAVADAGALFARLLRSCKRIQ